MHRLLKVIQVMILLLLPMLAVGVTFEVPEPGCCVMLLHCEHRHGGCCAHHGADAVQMGDDGCDCRCSHHHHERVRLLLEVGECPVRFPMVAPQIVCLPEQEMPLPQGGSDGRCLPVIAAPDDIRPAMRCRLRPLRC